MSFSYEAGKQILDKVSFTAKQGEITALVGPSGGGKTTSAMLAARFWDAEQRQGAIGRPRHKFRDRTRGLAAELLGGVPGRGVVQHQHHGQHPHRPARRFRRRGAERGPYWPSATSSSARWPDGYQTIIGENGETLSGGERQRISIARALLKNAPIVLLDEATASLDVENETKIQAGLCRSLHA